jgi:apurinic endonuclease APN1
MKTNSKRYLGAHVSCSGGLENAIVNGQALDINTIQIHPSPPQRWNIDPFADSVAEKFNARIGGSGIERIFFHAIYLINLGSPDARNWGLSKKSLINDLNLSAAIGGHGVIFHSGSLKDEPDEKKGLTRVATAINEIMDSADKRARLIIEVAAGSGAVIGDRLEELAEIYSQVECKERVGFGLDSQHLWASGYDLRNDLPGFVAQLQKTLTMEKIWSFHLNDSMTPLGSKKDRHENLGQGEIGEEGIKGILNHPVFRDVPFILETPGLKEPETAKDEVAKLLAWAE